MSHKRNLGSTEMLRIITRTSIRSWLMSTPLLHGYAYEYPLVLTARMLECIRHSTHVYGHRRRASPYKSPMDEEIGFSGHFCSIAPSSFRYPTINTFLCTPLSTSLRQASLLHAAAQPAFREKSLKCKQTLTWKCTQWGLRAQPTWLHFKIFSCLL